MTNFEKIKNMSMKKLADYLAGLVDCYGCRINCCKKTCKCAWIEWLKSEAENNG
mgnify:CR=1 FL=1